MGWRRDEREVLTAEFSDVEAAVLRELVTQLVELLDAADVRDPAVHRLLPDAYRDDVAAAAEFRRLTAQDLAGHKRDAAHAITRVVGDGGTVSMTDAEGWDWLRALTDLRLVLASRLGIDTEDDAAEPAVRGAAEPAVRGTADQAVRGTADRPDAAGAEAAEGTGGAADGEHSTDPDGDANDYDYDNDNDGDDHDLEREFLRNAFDWLGFVQETLVAAMERRA